MGKDGCIALAVEAMATRFEIVIHGQDESRLRAAGEEALAEIARLSERLSFYRPESEISRINACAARKPVRVEPGLFRLLQRARRVHDLTDRAFDVTIAPLMRAWGLTGAGGRVPSDAEIDAALATTGMHHIILDERDFTIRFDRDGIAIDLGAVGKGCAIETVVDLLRENGVTSAIVQGGTSTAYGIGRPPEQSAWRVAPRDPRTGGEMAPIDLTDSAVSVSAVYGKSFTEGGRAYGHVIDPRTGRPVEHSTMAVVTGPSPTECDALSTALLVLGESWCPILPERFPSYRSIVV